MPIYEYRCSNCGFQKEFIQKLSDAPVTHCPQCNTDKMEKLLSAAGFQLKGSGWYATDFRGKSSSTASNAGESTSGHSCGTACGCASGDAA